MSFIVGMLIGSALLSGDVAAGGVNGFNLIFAIPQVETRIKDPMQITIDTISRRRNRSIKEHYKDALARRRYTNNCLVSVFLKNDPTSSYTSSYWFVHTPCDNLRLVQYKDTP